MRHDLQSIQRALGDSGLDGWLFYDFRGSDPAAQSILGLPRVHTTRRWFYLLPTVGEPEKLVHAIEPGVLESLPGQTRRYLSWRELAEQLREIIGGRRRLAMQYSPHNAIPYVSRVDGGTLELVRDAGAEVVSSADLVQEFEATIEPEQWKTHFAAADILARLVRDNFDFIGSRLASGATVTEFEVQQRLLGQLAKHGLETDHPPIVAVGANSADPHYGPREHPAMPIHANELVMLDVWARLAQPDSIFADITWMAYTGRQPPADQTQVFEVVRAARDTALSAVQLAVGQGRAIRGCDVDDRCRELVRAAGYGEHFIHRTGHSIHTVGHGNGANLDNLETRDERRLIPETCFSIEPGIYLPGRFGVRSEINVCLTGPSGIIVSGAAPQEKLILIGSG